MKITYTVLVRIESRISWPQRSSGLNASWRLQSFSTLIVRLLLAGLAGFSEGAAMGAEVLRFPALVQNSVVVLVWWGVLVPFICALKPPNERCPSRVLPVLLAGVYERSQTERNSLLPAGARSSDGISPSIWSTCTC